MLIVYFVLALTSATFPLAHGAANCSVCELDDDFAPSNGYGCFPLNNGQVACTCPDGRYALDERCRICERENICGTGNDSFCSEIAEVVSDADGDRTHYFSCFCSDFTFHVGSECPSPTTTTVTTSTTAGAPILTMTTTTTTAVTRPVTTTTTAAAITTTTMRIESEN